MVQDLVERDLFQGAMKGGVSWLRLDGSVAPTARFDVVRQFNRDPTVEVRLSSMCTTREPGALGSIAGENLPFGLERREVSYVCCGRVERVLNCLQSHTAPSLLPLSHSPPRRA